MAPIVDKDNTLDVNVTEELQKAMPSYARPFFRKLNEDQSTGTPKKSKKLDFQTEGFDVKVINDSLYYCNSKGVYLELTLEAYKDILSGKIRL